MLSDSDFLRYSRQVMLPACGENGVLKLQQSRVVIIGLGGLGCIAAPYLAGAGVGYLELIDDDLVSTSNLPRQWFYAGHQGQAKVEVAKAALQAVNADTDIAAFVEQLSDDNALLRLQGADLVLDCSDNMTTRQLINRTCLTLGIPFVSAAAIGMDAQCLAINPDFCEHSATERSYGCYHCLYPFDDLVTGSCRESGVMGPVVGMAASQQATLALQVLLGVESVPWSVLWRMDCAQFFTQCVAVPKDRACPVCAANTEQEI